MIDIPSLVIGITLGIVIAGAWVKINLNERARRAALSTGKRVAGFALVAAFVAVVAFGSATPTLAQTPVPLEVPTDVIFTETNNWLATFAPLAAIGTGISIAIAVLGYIGKMIVGAFK